MAPASSNNILPSQLFQSIDTENTSKPSLSQSVPSKVQDSHLSSLADRLASIEATLDSLNDQKTQRNTSQNTKNSYTRQSFDFYTESLLDDRETNVAKKLYRDHDQFRHVVADASKEAMKFLLKDCQGSQVNEEFKRFLREERPLGQDNTSVELVHLSLLKDKMQVWRKSYGVKQPERRQVDSVEEQEYQEVEEW